MTTVTDQLSYKAERQSLADASNRLYAADVMSKSGHMNLSTPIGEGAIILASGPTLETMTVIEGDTPASAIDPSNAEIIRMHTEVYRVRPELRAIIHTHSPQLLAFAMANQPLPDRYEALLRFGQAEEVPVVPWAPRGSERSVSGIVDLVRSRPTTQAVLLGNHGVLVFGTSPAAAAQLLIVLEEAAGAELLAGQSLGGAKDFPEGALDEVRSSIARGQEVARSSH